MDILAELYDKLSKLKEQNDQLSKELKTLKKQFKDFQNAASFIIAYEGDFDKFKVDLEKHRDRYLEKHQLFQSNRHSISMIENTIYTLNSLVK